MKRTKNFAINKIFRANARILSIILMRHFIIILLTLFTTVCNSQRLAIIKVNNKFGCIDKKGKIVIQPVWDYILKGAFNKIYLVQKDNLYGFIDNTGKIIIKPQYEKADTFNDGLAAVSNGKKYGFINLKGELVIPFLYKNPFMGFQNGLCDVALNDSCGYIDKKGKIIIPLIYKTCYPFMSNYAEVETFDGHELLIDKKGNKYDYADVSEKHRLWVPRNVYPGAFTTTTGQGRVNDKGDTIVPPIYKVTGNLRNHMYIVQDKTNKWGAYTDKGQFTVPCQFDNLWHFHEELANFLLNGKWGFVDKKGRIIIQPIFEYASEFTDGLAYVEINGKSGFINKKGIFIIEPKFEINKDSRFQ